MQQVLGPVWGRPAVAGCRPKPHSPCCQPAGRHIAVHAAKGGSPWSTGPGSSKGSSSNSSKGSGKSSGKSSSKSSGGGSKGGSSSKAGSSKPKSSKPKSSKAVPSGTGFAPKGTQQQQVPVYKLTAPLTPQLLDELSGWEMVPAPLWGTFTGHCEGEWLGQYAAYTPWGGDPEPVWADESGAYLLNAYSRASEQRQQVPAEADADSDEDADMLVRTTLRSASVSSLIGGTSASRAAAAAAAERAAARAAEAAGSGSAAAAVAAAVNGADAAAEEAAAADDDAEGFAYNSGGSVVFNGGSYSIGPEQLEGPGLDIDLQELAAEDPDALANLPHSTAVFEAALVAGGDVRLRMVATLKLRTLPGEAELDVEVARLLLYKEYWYGTAESTAGLTRKSKQLAAAAAAAAAADADTPSSSSSSEIASGHVLQLLPSHKFDVPVVNLPRPQPQQVAGCWNVFLVAANPIVEENPDTLQEEEVLMYSSREERQQWHVPGLTSSAAVGSSISSSNGSSSNGTGAGAAGDPSTAAAAAAAAEDLDDDGSGGSFWLPGGAVVTIRMVQWSPAGTPGAAAAAAAASSNGNGTSSGIARGLHVGLHWLVDGGSCLFVERQYDAEGVLAEVRQGTAVKGGWSGGRM